MQHGVTQHGSRAGSPKITEASCVGKEVLQDLLCLLWEHPQMLKQLKKGSNKLKFK